MQYLLQILSSTSAWLLSPLECSPPKQNGCTLRFCFWGWIMWKMYNKTIIEFGFRVISWISKTSCLCYLRLRQITQTRGFDNSWYLVQPNPIIVWYTTNFSYSDHDWLFYSIAWYKMEYPTSHLYFLTLVYTEKRTSGSWNVSWFSTREPC